MAAFRRFEDIDAWQKGRELVKRVYALTRSGALVSDYVGVVFVDSLSYVEH